MDSNYFIGENGMPDKGPHGLWAEGELEAAMRACGWRDANPGGAFACWVKDSDSSVPVVSPQACEHSSGREARWIAMSERRPAVGSLIVKHWRRNGAVWAGTYYGTDKESSFDDWMLLNGLSVLCSPPSGMGEKEGG